MDTAEVDLRKGTQLNNAVNACFEQQSLDKPVLYNDFETKLPKKNLVFLNETHALIDDPNRFDVDCDDIAELATKSAGHVRDEKGLVVIKATDGSLIFRDKNGRGSFTSAVIDGQKKAAADRMERNLTYQAVADANNAGNATLTVASYKEGKDEKAKNVKFKAEAQNDGSIKFTRFTADNHEMFSTTLSAKQVHVCELYTQITPADLFKYRMMGVTADKDRTVSKDNKHGIVVKLNDAEVSFSDNEIKDAVIPFLQSNKDVFNAIKTINAKAISDSIEQRTMTLKNVAIGGVSISELEISKPDDGCITLKVAETKLSYIGKDTQNLVTDKYQPKLGIGTAGALKTSGKSSSNKTINNSTLSGIELGSSVLRSAAALTEQQLRRIYGDDSKHALIGGIVLDGLRVTNDLIAAGNEYNSGRFYVVDAAATSWVLVDLYDIYEKALQLKNGKKSDLIVDASDTEIKPENRNAKTAAKLSALFKQAAPGLEALWVFARGCAKYKNPDANLIRLAYYSTAALSAIRSMNMIFTTDSKSVKHKIAYGIGALTLLGFIIDMFIKPSTGRSFGSGAEITIDPAHKTLDNWLLNLGSDDKK